MQLKRWYEKYSPPFWYFLSFALYPPVKFLEAIDLISLKILKPVALYMGLYTVKSVFKLPWFLRLVYACLLQVFIKTTSALLFPIVIFMEGLDRGSNLLMPIVTSVVSWTFIALVTALSWTLSRTLFLGRQSVKFGYNFSLFLKLVLTPLLWVFILSTSALLLPIVIFMEGLDRGSNLLKDIVVSAVSRTFDLGLQTVKFAFKFPWLVRLVFAFLQWVFIKSVLASLFPIVIFMEGLGWGSNLVKDIVVSALSWTIFVSLLAVKFGFKQFTGLLKFAAAFLQWVFIKSVLASLFPIVIFMEGLGWGSNLLKNIVVSALSWTFFVSLRTVKFGFKSTALLRIVFASLLWVFIKTTSALLFPIVIFMEGLDRGSNLLKPFVVTAISWIFIALDEGLAWLVAAVVSVCRWIGGRLAEIGPIRRPLFKNPYVIAPLAIIAITSFSILIYTAKPLLRSPLKTISTTVVIEPVVTEPVETKIVETEIVEMEIVETEPVETEIVKTEPVKEESVEVRTAQREPAKVAPAQRETIETAKLELLDLLKLPDDEPPLYKEDYVAPDIETLKEHFASKKLIDISRGEQKSGELSITFDGGETNHAREILGVLKDKGIETTFFLTGLFIYKNPELVLEILRSGHEVGNHTMDHPHLTAFNDTLVHKTLPDVTKQYFLDQIESTARIYKELTGENMAPYWRAPYGEINSELTAWALEAGFVHVGWTRDYKNRKTLDSLDWVTDKEAKIYHTAMEIKDRILDFDTIEPGLNGAIILMHLGTRRREERAVSVLGDIIDEVRLKGFNFVKVSRIAYTMLDAPLKDESKKRLVFKKDTGKTIALRSSR